PINRGNRDHLYDGGPYNTPYTSGFVFVVCGDSVVLPPFGPNGGRRTAEIGDFGQNGLVGARFRGAWIQSDTDPSIPYAPSIYDPGSLFGKTVDTMPDINNTAGGRNELIISAPASGRSVTGTADLTAALTGTYDPAG